MAQQHIHSFYRGKKRQFLLQQETMTSRRSKKNMQKAWNKCKTTRNRVTLDNWPMISLKTYARGGAPLVKLTHFKKGHEKNVKESPKKKDSSKQKKFPLNMRHKNSINAVEEIQTHNIRVSLQKLQKQWDQQLTKCNQLKIHQFIISPPFFIFFFIIRWAWDSRREWKNSLPGRSDHPTTL